MNRDGLKQHFASREKLLPGDSREFLRNDAHTFLDGNDLVDRNFGESVHLPAGPRDLERFDGLAFPQAKMNAWVTC